MGSHEGKSEFMWDVTNKRKFAKKKAQGESEKKREREMKPNYIDAIFILT